VADITGQLRRPIRVYLPLPWPWHQLGWTWRCLSNHKFSLGIPCGDDFSCTEMQH
jgi:hypothetical protein